MVKKRAIWLMTPATAGQSRGSHRRAAPPSPRSSAAASVRQLLAVERVAANSSAISASGAIRRAICAGQAM